LEKDLNKAVSPKHWLLRGERLQRIGCVIHISSNKNLILKAEKTPRIGDKVVNEHLKSVGTVFDVFGPTSSPYVAVKPNSEKTYHLVNHVLYTIPSTPKMKRRRKRR
jgi:rRNA processing protein Gar1